MKHKHCCNATHHRVCKCVYKLQDLWCLDIFHIGENETVVLDESNSSNFLCKQIDREGNLNNSEEQSDKWREESRPKR